MIKRYSQFITFLFLIISFQIQAQFSFTNATSTLLEESEFFSGVAIGIADINNDGRDDIVRLDSAKILQIEYQKPNGGMFASFEEGEIAFDGEWAIVLGDVNNDGYNDIMTGGAYDHIKLFTYNPMTFQFNKATLPNSQIFLQGANFADINNDGFLDAFGCHDDAESHIWVNDGNGNMISANEMIDMATKPISDNSGNYGSVWTDFDNDKDLDLYIAKCRQGVTNTADPRRINALFENDGNNNYWNNSEARNLKIEHQSWTAEFQDIDNDGDFDCFITNHDHQCQILENDGAGNFEDITSQTNVDINGYIWQGIMRDVDNDGFMDIIATPGGFYRNNGDKTFTKLSNSISSSNPNSIACGDLNHDGFLDFYTSYPVNINFYSDKSDQLFLNNGNDNNYLAVNLEGIESNKKGVGARIEIHGSWGIQIREVRAGESYGISNTLTQHFGLGTETEIDYLVVKWPSGNVDVIQNPEPNQFLTVVENSSCQIDPIDLTLNGNNIICPGESVEISAPDGYSYLWQNGDTNQSIITESAGNFSAVLIDNNGCVAFSNVVSIEYAPDETPTIEIDGNLNFCQGGTVVLTSSEAMSYEWNNGETTQSVSVSQSGEYFVIINGNCENWTSQVVTVEVFDSPSIPVVENDTIFAPGNAVLTAQGANPHWYESQISTTSLGEGSSFETPFIDETTTYYVEDILGYGGGLYNVGMPIHVGGDYNGPNFNGELLFDVESPIVLKTIKTYTESEFYGERLIELRDQFGDLVNSKSVDIQADSSIIELNFEIPIGNDYVLVTNTDVNIANIGSVNPMLKRSNENVQYPYVLNDIVRIKDSNGGPGFYYYFFDWEIEAAPTLECHSERVSVDAVVQVTNTYNHEDLSHFSVFPNPSNGLVNLEIASKESGKYSIVLTDLNGKKIIQKTIELYGDQMITKDFNLSDFPKGMYFMNIEKDGKVGWAKLLIE